MRPLRKKWTTEMPFPGIRALLSIIAPTHDPNAQATPTLASSRYQTYVHIAPTTIANTDTAVVQPAPSVLAPSSTATSNQEQASNGSDTTSTSGSQKVSQYIPIMDQNHPLQEEYENVVLPDLRRMIHKYFSTEGFQRIQIDPLVGSSPQKLTILIHCPNPGEMKKAIKKTRCIDERKFDVKYKKGEKLRRTAGTGGVGNHPREPNISGNPIAAFRQDELLGTALIGGLVLIQGENDCYFETTVFHFLAGAQETYQSMEVSHAVPDITEDDTTSFVTWETSSSTCSFSTLGPEDQPEESSSPDESHSFEDVQLRTSAQTEGRIGSLLVGVDEYEQSVLQRRICHVSGVRVSKVPFDQTKSDGSLRSIMDWALISVGNGLLSPTTYSKKGVSVAITSTASPRGRAVDILVEGQIYCQGTTGGLPSLLPLQGKPEFGLAFMVSTDRKLRECSSYPDCYCGFCTDEGTMPTEEGMSGAWLVDSTTTELVGHLIAVSASSPWGYFIPIVEMIEDIKATLNASTVSLPRKGMDAIHLPPGNTERTHPIATFNDARENETDPKPNSQADTRLPDGDRTEVEDKIQPVVASRSGPPHQWLPEIQNLGFETPAKTELEPIMATTTAAPTAINPWVSVQTELEQDKQTRPTGDKLWRNTPFHSLADKSSYLIPANSELPTPKRTRTRTCANIFLKGKFADWNVFLRQCN